MRARFGFGWAALVLSLAACGGDDDGGAGMSGTGGMSGIGGIGGIGGGDACTASSCSDSLYCNGEEQCDPGNSAADNNGCVRSTAVNCNDGIACTIDSCDEALNTCANDAPDQDDDGHNDATCLNANNEPAGDDCNDNDADRFPGNTERCDAIDQDCEPATVGYRDEDGDGSIDDICCNTDDANVERCGGDCNDNNIAQRRGQPEFCDNLDNDCDGIDDNNAVRVRWYIDADGDGFGDENDLIGMLSCEALPGRSFLNTDCDDGDITLQPAQVEACDALDNNCNVRVDENLLNCDSTDPNEPPLPVNECINQLDDCDDATERCEDTPSSFNCVAITEPTNPCTVNNGGCGDPLYYDCDDSTPGVMRTCVDINECDDGSNGGCGNDEACIDIPGAAPICVNEVSCSGDFTIVDSSDLTTLANRACTRLTGSLIINGTALDSLVGLETIRWIEGALVITSNSALTSGIGLANLVRVGSYIEMNANPVLTDIGLVSLRTVGGYFDILGDATLSNLDGLNALVRCEQGFSLWDNAALTNTSAVSNLQYAGGADGFSINANPSLTTLSFPALREVSNFGVVANSRLTSLGNFPVLNVVSGDLLIVYGTGLTSLNGLNALTTVGGSVGIRQNDELRNLNMVSIETIGGNVEIISNPKLASVAGFGSLTRVGGSLIIASHDQLTSVSGFANLERAGTLAVDNNLALTNIAGFGKLTAVAGSLEIHNNPVLTRVAGFGALQSVDGSVFIAANPALIELDAIDSLTTVGLDLRIEGNRVLNSLAGLRSGTLRSVGNRLMIRINPQLSACEVNVLRAGLNDNDWNVNDLSAANRGCSVCNGASCTSGAGGLLGQSTVFAGSTPLDEDDFTVGPNTALDLLANVTEITGDLSVTNTALSNLTSLTNLTTVGGDFTIEINNGLANLNALSRLTHVEGTLRIAGNEVLGNLGGGSNGLVNLTSVGGLYVNGNANLMNANALADLVTCSGNLLIDNSAVLTTINLSALTTVGGGFSVSANDELTTLSANMLQEIGGQLSIYYNAQLPSLGGFSALRTLGGNLQLQGNEALSQCAADALRDQLNGWSGVYVSDTNLLCSDTCNGAVCQ